jgi:hypothetical protein
MNGSGKDTIQYSAIHFFTRLQTMKIYIAAVATVTDYRKEQDVSIMETSAHTTEREAKKAVLFQICLAMGPELIMEIGNFAKFFDLSSILGEEVTPSRRIRLQQWLKHSSIGDCDLEEDDVPTEKEDFDAFLEIEKPILERLADIFSKKFKDKEIHFSQAFEDSTADFKIPRLPEGEYVFQPIVYRISEQEFDVGDDERKRQKVSL